MATMYPGKGVQLTLANSTYPKEPVWLSMRTPDPVIPDSSSSLGIATNAGLATELNVVFDSAPTTTAFDVMYASEPDFSNEYILESIPATTDVLYTWTTQAIRMSGFIRVTNTGTADINEVWAQQTSATFG